MNAEQLAEFDVTINAFLKQNMSSIIIKHTNFATIDEFPQLQKFHVPHSLFDKFTTSRIALSNYPNVGSIVFDRTYGNGGNVTRVCNRVYAGDTYRVNNEWLTSDDIRCLTVEQAQELVDTLSKNEQAQEAKKTQQEANQQ